MVNLTYKKKNFFVCLSSMLKLYEYRGRDFWNFLEISNTFITIYIFVNTVKITFLLECLINFFYKYNIISYLNTILRENNYEMGEKPEKSWKIAKCTILNIHMQIHGFAPFCRIIIFSKFSRPNLFVSSSLTSLMHSLAHVKKSSL